MHKIIEITPIPLTYHYPTEKRVSLGIGQATKRDTIIVRIRTSDGITGYGEAHPGRSPGAVVSLINHNITPLILGMQATDVAGVWSRVYRMQLASHGLGSGAALALSGIDMALWDIRGKLSGMPLYELLGGSKRRVKAYAGGISLGYQPAGQLADEASGYVESGYRAVKLRVGDTARNDIERVTEVRKRLGDEIDILVDANAAYTLADVRRVLPVFEEMRVGWLEEPFACNNFANYREAAAISRTVPLAAGENHYTRFEFAQLLESGSVKIYQPDLSKTGGITEGFRIASLLSAWGASVHPHSSSTSLNHAACVHLLSAVDNPGYFEACVSLSNPFRDMFGRICTIGPDGCVEAPEGPGLGVSVDESLFDRYPSVDGPGYIVKF